MKKTLLLLLSVYLLYSADAQLSKLFKKRNKNPQNYVKTDAPKEKPDFSKVNMKERAADHLVLQYGADTWIGKPDSARTGGFSRSFNAYLMFDKPFKTNPYFSLAYGAGIGSSNIFFDKVNVQVNANSPTLPFSDVSGGIHFNKFKLTTIYLEIPAEIRYYSNPINPNRSWKLAAGLKAGTLIKAYTKGKDLQDKNNASIYGSTYIQKTDDSRFINSILVAGTIRVGYGNFSLHSDFQITPVLKAGAGSDIHTLSIGLTISGL